MGARGDREREIAANQRVEAATRRTRAAAGIDRDNNFDAAEWLEEAATAHEQLALVYDRENS